MKTELIDHTTQILLRASVFIHSGRVTTASPDVARFFGKNHQHVLRDIRGLIEPEDGPHLDCPPADFQPRGLPKSGESAYCKSGLSMAFAKANFVPGNYQNEQNKTQPMYELTFDGFVLLVMGYTGQRAMAIKEAYIAQFNRMRTELAAIKSNALAMAHRQLEQRNKDWPVIRAEYSRAGGNGKRIEDNYGFGRGKVSRNVRRMVQWGYMSEKDVQTYQRLHREVGVALRQVRALQQQNLFPEL